MVSLLCTCKADIRQEKSDLKITFTKNEIKKNMKNKKLILFLCLLLSSVKLYGQYNIDSLKRLYPQASAVFLNYSATWDFYERRESFDYIVLDTTDSKLFEFFGRDIIQYERREITSYNKSGSRSLQSPYKEKDPKGPVIRIAAFDKDGNRIEDNELTDGLIKTRRDIYFNFNMYIKKRQIGMRIKGTVVHAQEYFFFLPPTYSGACVDFEWPASTFHFDFSSFATIKEEDEVTTGIFVGKELKPLVKQGRKDNICEGCVSIDLENYKPRKREVYTLPVNRPSNLIFIHSKIEIPEYAKTPLYPHYPTSKHPLFVRNPEIIHYNSILRYPYSNNNLRYATRPKDIDTYRRILRSSLSDDIESMKGDFEDAVEDILESHNDLSKRAEMIVQRINSFRLQDFPNIKSMTTSSDLEKKVGSHKSQYETLIGSLRSAGISAIPIRIYTESYDQLDSNICETEHFLFGIELIIAGKPYYAFSYPEADLNWMPENLGGMPYERILDCEDQDEDFCEEMNPPKERWGVIPKSELWSASISDSLDVKVNSDGTASIIERRTYYNQAALDIERLCRKNSRLVRDSVLVRMHSGNESLAKNVSVSVGSLDKSIMALAVEWKYTVGIGTTGSFLLQDIFSLAPPAHEEGARENPIITYPNVETKRHISISADGATVTTNPVNIVHTTMFGTNSAVAKSTGAGISIDTHHAMVFAQAGKEKAEELYKISNHKATRALQQIIIQR